METSLKPFGMLTETMESISRIANAKVPDSVTDAIDLLTKPAKLNIPEFNFEEVIPLPPASVTML